MVTTQKFVVGIGGAHRSGSSTELAIKGILAAAEHMGARTVLFAGPDLELPMYVPGSGERCAKAQAMIAALREADAVVVGSPGYHGGVSGLVKNALDYVEDMSCDERCYFDGLPVACVATGGGFQGANAALIGLRSIVHALRGWPTPLGLALNSAKPLFDESGLPLESALADQFGAIARHLLEFRIERENLRGAA